MFSLASALLVFFLILGVLFMGIGWRMRLSAIERRSSWRHARGVVVEVVAVQLQGTDAGSGVMFAPVVEYANDVTNKPIRFEDPLASSPASHKVGDVVDVLFNPSKPSQACIYAEMRIFAPAALFFGAGATFVLFAIFGKFH